MDKLVFLLIKFENDRKKCADTLVKTDASVSEEQVIYYVSGCKIHQTH